MMFLLRFYLSSIFWLVIWFNQPLSFKYCIVGALSLCVCFLCIQLCVIMVFNIWCWFILCHLCKKRWCTFSAANIWIEQLCDNIFRINSHFAANRKQKSIWSIFVTFHRENEIEMKWSKTKFQSVWYPQKQLMLFWNTNEKKIS